jgi:hypothetical protein
MGWIDMVQDRDWWRALVDTVTNLWVPYNVGKFLSSCTTGGFSRRSQLHGELSVYIKSAIFWAVVSCSPVEVHPCFRGTYAGDKQSLLAVFLLATYLGYSSTLKMDAVCSSKTSVNFEWTTWHDVSEDITLHSHQCEELKPTYKLAVSVKKVCCAKAIKFSH